MPGGPPGAPGPGPGAPVYGPTGGAPGYGAPGYGPPPGGPGYGPGWGPRPTPPGKALRITGGVLTIVTSAIVFLMAGLITLLGAIFTSAGHDLGSSDVQQVGGTIVVVGFATALLAMVGIVLGAMCAAGKPVGAIGGGIVMLLLLALGVLNIATGGTTSWGFMALEAAAAAFSFAGLGQCKAWQTYRAAGGS